MIAAFDIDGTLRTLEGKPNQPVIDLLHIFQTLGYDIVVWSGGGVEYAKNVVDSLNLKNVHVRAKGSIKPEIAFDDQRVNLGYNNICVDRSNIQEY